MSLRTLTVPVDYDDILSQYTHKGYRVIACAAKYEPKLSWMKVQKMTRADAECDLEFVGFIIFENKLKPTTAGVISELGQAGIRNVVCTGDNILTAVSVSRECGLLGSDEQCFIPHFVDGQSAPLFNVGEYFPVANRLAGDNVGPRASLCWENVDNPAYKLDEHTLMVKTLGSLQKYQTNPCSPQQHRRPLICLYLAPLTTCAIIQLHLPGMYSGGL